MINANAMFNGYREFTTVTHSAYAVAHQFGLSHEAGAKPAVLNPIRGAATVQIDLIVAPARSQPCAGRQVFRIGTAQLQCYRMLFLTKAQMPLDIAMQHCSCRHHLGVDPRAARQRAPKPTTVPVGPVHTGCSAETPRIVGAEICH